MSELSKLTSAGDASALPGYIISPLRLSDFGVLEERFAEWHVRRAERGARRASHDVAADVINKAVERTETGEFTYGMPLFRMRCISSRGMSLILWLSLKIKHPQMTLSQVRDLRNNATNQYALGDAIMAAAGFSEGSPATSEPAESPSQSDGATSSPPSETAALDGTKSAA